MKGIKRQKSLKDLCNISYYSTPKICNQCALLIPAYNQYPTLHSSVNCLIPAIILIPYHSYQFLHRIDLLIVSSILLFLYRDYPNTVIKLNSIQINDLL